MKGISQVVRTWFQVDVATWLKPINLKLKLTEAFRLGTLKPKAITAKAHVG